MWSCHVHHHRGLQLRTRGQAHTTNSSVAPQDLADALAKEELGTACGLRGCLQIAGCQHRITDVSCEWKMDATRQSWSSGFSKRIIIDAHLWPITLKIKGQPFLDLFRGPELKGQTHGFVAGNHSLQKHLALW